MGSSLKKNKGMFDIINFILLLAYALLIIYPFLNMLAISLNDGADTIKGGITIYPRKLTFDNYILIFKNPSILSAFGITVSRTIVGTVVSLFFTSMFAYGMSRKNLMGKKIYMTICIVTMYFSGGLIPYYLLINKLGLVNKFLVYIIPYLTDVFYMIIMRTYFRTLPDSFEESAKIDGAGQFTILFRIILPVSKAIIATIALFFGVFQWNQWFDAYIFTTREDLLPIQNVLIQIMNLNSMGEALAKAGSGSGIVEKFSKISSKSINMSTMIIAIIPIIMVYPFIQKYFIKGVMLGSIKS